jgi:hypothetical protein
LSTAHPIKPGRSSQKHWGRFPDDRPNHFFVFVFRHDHPNKSKAEHHQVRDCLTTASTAFAYLLHLRFTANTIANNQGL